MLQELDFMVKCINMKESFWNTKTGKILSHGIHEHSSGISLIKANLNLLAKDFVRDEKCFSKEDHERMMKTCKNSLQKCKDSIDYIYTKLKENEDY